MKNTSLFCRTYLFIVALLLIKGVWGQGIHHYPRQGFSVEDGLSQSSVYHILKDSTGYIWAGSGDGLNRISPQQIRSFKSVPGDSLSLAAPAIRGLLEGANGRIWIGTERGLHYYDAPTKTIQQRIKNRLLPGGSVIPLVFHDGRLICVQQWEGFFALNVDNGEIEHRFPFDSMLPTNLHAYTLFGDELYLANSTGNLLVLNLKNGSIQKLRGDWVDGTALTALTVLPDGSIFLAAGQQLYKSGVGHRNWQLIHTAPAVIHVMEIVNDHELWISTEGMGILRLDFSGNTIEGPIREINWSGNTTIDISTVYTIEQTSDNMVWLGVESLGAMALYPNSDFVTITRNDPYFPGIAHAFCRYILPLSNSELLMHTYLGGIYHLDLDEKRSTVVEFDHKIGEQIYFLEHWKGGLLVGSQTGLWQVPDIRNGKIGNVGQLSEEVFQSAVSAERNHLLVSDATLYELNSKGLHPIQTLTENIRCVATSRNGGYYVLINDELKHFGADDQLLATEAGFSNYNIKSLMFCENAGLWAATGNGIIQIDEQNLKVIHHLTTANGLPDNTVYGLLPAEGALWGSTNRGLFRLNLSTLHSVTFSQRDGLQSNEFNSRAFAKMPDGRFVFGGINGLSLFHPEDFASMHKPGKPALNGVSVNGIEITDTDESHQFNFNDRNFRYSFDMLEWRHHKNCQVVCRLKGFDENWNRLSAGNIVQYSSLQPGNYELWAKVVSGYGSESDAIRFVEFTVAPPYYQSWWFILTTVISGLLVIGILTYYLATQKFRRKLKALQRQKEMDELRKRISRDIHDDVGSNLSKLSMHLAQMERSGSGSSFPWEKVKRLSRQAMEGLSEVVWTINSDYDRLPDMVAWFRSYASEFFEGTGISVAFQVSGVCPDKTVDPELRRNLLMLYKEALNNIAKHAEARSVQIVMSCQPDGHVHLAIRDDGKGFSPELKSTRNGLRNMEFRVKKSGWTWSVTSAAGQGTEIEFSGYVN